MEIGQHNTPIKINIFRTLEFSLEMTKTGPKIQNVKVGLLWLLIQAPMGGTMMLILLQKEVVMVLLGHME